MEKVGYKFIADNGDVLQSWGGVWGQTAGVPDRIICPNGDIVYSPAVGENYGGATLVEWFMDPPPAQIPASITRRQCAVEMRERGQITALEALNMTRNGAVPAMVQNLLAASGLTEEQRIIAETDFAADQYMRDNSLLNQMMQASGATSSDVDEFFRSAASR